MSLRARLYGYWMKKRPKSMSSAKVIAVAFALIILLGTCLPNRFPQNHGVRTNGIRHSDEKLPPKPGWQTENQTFSTNAGGFAGDSLKK